MPWEHRRRTAWNNADARPGTTQTHGLEGHDTGRDAGSDTGSDTGRATGNVV